MGVRLRGCHKRGLAEKASTHTKTIGVGESGDRFPLPYHRQSLCEIFGKNAEELGLLRENPRNIKPLSPPSHRLTIPEASVFPTPTTAPSQSLLLEEARASDHVSPTLPRADWGEAPYVVNLYGRDVEGAELKGWVGEHHCQIAAVLGMGGVGKTAVAAKVAMQMKVAFEYVFWRSLQNAPR